MATLPDAMSSGASDTQSAQPVLHMEMQAGERRLLTLFASSFLKWIKDGAASSFARDVGTPASVSLDESGRDAQTLHLTVTWSQSPESSLFTYESETPVFDRSLAEADVTMMMAAVFEQSARLGRRPTRPVPAWVPAPLVAAAARGSQVLERWTDAAIDWITAVLDRSRPRVRQVAALCDSARLASLAHARSVVYLLRSRPSAAIKPLSWAAAGLVAASVIYVGWSIAKPAAKPVAREVATAANPTASQPAPRIEQQAQKSPATLVADARPTEAAPLLTSGAVPATLAVPAAPANQARAAENTTRVKSAPQARGYVGSLVVTSDPQGAAVLVDGVPRGRTPVAITNLNIGSRVVRLDLPGHQSWSWAVSVVANRRTPIAVRLSPVTRANVTPGASPDDASAPRPRNF